MGLSNPRSTYGIHSASPYNRSTGLFYGTMKVLDSSSLSLTAEQNDLTGGSNKYPWASEDGAISAEMSLKVGQMEDFMFELFLGKAPTAQSAETSGNVSTLTNKNGTSVVAATGIASVSAITTTGPANLKFGKYVVKAMSATTVKVYHSTDIDHARGTDVEYADDQLSVTASALTITTGADTNIAALGVKLVGGAGTIGMTTGDTATFEVRPINTKSMGVRIGAAADVFPEFGCIIMAQQRSTGEMFEVDAFRCKASGMPIGFEAFAWNKPEVKAKLLYDSVKNGVFDVRHVTP